MNGFIDLQINGYAGVDFNAVELDRNRFLHATDIIQKDGTEQFLATLITAPFDEMLLKIERIASWLEDDPKLASVVKGLHIEGPFLSPVDGYIGAHPSSATVMATTELAAQLIEHGRGWVRMVTLAPEMDPGSKVTRYLTDRGIVVAAGHCDPSIDQLNQAIDQGLRLYTHLGNGCPSMLARHDNIIQRVLSVSERLMVSFIADGHHVPMFALANYLKCLPDHNIIIVTDAISAAGLGPGRYQLSNQVVEVDADGSAWAECRTH
ncbi:N-acetylglucosamine-6-phosphate deacetylase, partial [bacterium]|nr:N-acetylglucosamine-6-phosphate deacetylase [bacterium]